MNRRNLLHGSIASAFYVCASAVAGGLAGLAVSVFDSSADPATMALTAATYEGFAGAALLGGAAYFTPEDAVAKIALRARAQPPYSWISTGQTTMFAAGGAGLALLAAVTDFYPLGRPGITAALVATAAQGLAMAGICARLDQVLSPRAERTAQPAL